MLIAPGALREWFGETGIIVAAAVAGFVDAHSPAIAVASLVPAEKMAPRRTFNQYNQQSYFRMDRWKTVIRVALDSGLDLGCGRGLDRCTAIVMDAEGHDHGGC